MPVWTECVQVSFQVPASSSFGYISRSGISRSYGNHVFHFLRFHHTVFWSRHILHLFCICGSLLREMGVLVWRPTRGCHEGEARWCLWRSQQGEGTQSGPSPCPSLHFLGRWSSVSSQTWEHLLSPGVSPPASWPSTLGVSSPPSVFPSNGPLLPRPWCSSCRRWTWRRRPWPWGAARWVGRLRLPFYPWHQGPTWDLTLVLLSFCYFCVSPFPPAERRASDSLPSLHDKAVKIKCGKCGWRDHWGLSFIRGDTLRDLSGLQSLHLDLSRTFWTSERPTFTRSLAAFTLQPHVTQL